MPKVLEYPRASMKNSLKVAETVDALGGNCNMATCAAQMGKKVSGGFKALLGAASKYGLIKCQRGNLTITQLYKDYKLSYNEQEKIANLRKSFFGVPLFKKIYDKYQNVKLPIDILDKAMIKEFYVEDKIALRVSGYFIDAAKMVKLLNSDNTFVSVDSKTNEPQPIEENSSCDSNDEEVSVIPGIKQEPLKVWNKDNYIVSIKGPSINTTIEVAEEDHFMIVEAILNTIKKKLKERKDNYENTRSADKNNG